MKTSIFFALAMAGGFTTNAQSAQLTTVQENYARFGQGDIPGIIGTLADNVVWVHPGNPSIVTFAGEYKGHDGVGQFFTKVGQDSQITAFAPSNFREKGNAVSNDVHIEGVIPSTGKTYVSDIVMTWTFGPDGKVTRWEATGDVASLEQAFSK